MKNEWRVETTKPVKLAWIEPFRGQGEMEAKEYQAAFAPALPRRTAINRLNRMRDAGLVVRLGKTRATIYRLTEAGWRRLGGAVGMGHELARPRGARMESGRRADLSGGEAPQQADTTAHRNEWRQGGDYVGIETGWDDDAGSPSIVGEEPAEFGSTIQFSPEARETLRYLRRPVAEREPVGYRREFLDAYRPNESWYLPESLRTRLRALGQQPEALPDSAHTYARDLCERLLIDLSWSSSRLEGNTYSLLETEQLLRAGHSRDGGLSREAVMILNHKAAIEFLLDPESRPGFERRCILNLHALLTADLLRDPADEGQLRSTPVAIARSAYLPTAIPALIDEAFHTFLDKARAIEDPFEQAFFAMVHIPYLQPFLDGNKRVSRLAALIPLIRRNLAPLSFLDVPKADYTEAILAIYELNDVRPLTDVFAHAYETSARRYTVVRTAMGDPDPFRIAHRKEISALVAEIVRHRMTREEAAEHIRQKAAVLTTESDRERFAAVVEQSLSGLHEGNFARHRIRPSEFDAWKEVWEADGV